MFESRLIPVLLIIGSLLAATAVAFGCDPSMTDRAGGVDLIRVMYRMQWLFVGATVVCSLGLVGLVVTSRRRGYWLLGLLPVVALFSWRFGLSPERPGMVDDAPVFVQAIRTDWLQGDAPVLGIVSGEKAYAIPLAAMEFTPVVVHTERDRRLVVTWSEGAHLATACWTERTLRGRDLRIVASPRGVLMLFNSRVGEFFDGLTFAQRNGQPFTGFTARVAVELTTFDAWKGAHVDTLLLDPRRPLEVVRPPEPQAVDSVIYIASTPPIVVPAEEFGGEPANVTNGRTSALLFRDGKGKLRAFERRVDHDLFLRFEPHTGKSQTGPAFIDTETKSGWTTTGQCIEGALAGKRLERLVVIDQVPAAAARYWVR